MKRLNPALAATALAAISLASACGRAAGQTAPVLQTHDLIRIEGAARIDSTTVRHVDVRGRISAVRGDSATLAADDGRAIVFSVRDIERLRVLVGKRSDWGRAGAFAGFGALVGGAAGAIVAATSDCRTNPSGLFTPCEQHESQPSDGEWLAYMAIGGAVVGFILGLVPTDHWMDADRTGLGVNVVDGRAVFGVSWRP